MLKAVLYSASLRLQNSFALVFMGRNEVSSVHLARQKDQVSHFHQPGLNFTPDEGCVNALRTCSSRIFEITVIGV